MFGIDRNDIVFGMAFLGTLCWGSCFWWMHRISARQNALLDQLHAQGKRIERLSRIEHDLIKEVHPQVGEIKEDLRDVAEAVKENSGKS